MSNRSKKVGFFSGSDGEYTTFPQTPKVVKLGLLLKTVFEKASPINAKVFPTATENFKLENCCQQQTVTVASSANYPIQSIKSELENLGFRLEFLKIV